MHAVEFNLAPGLSADLDTGFDLRLPVARARVWAHLTHEKPRLLVTSAPRTWYCKLMNLNMHRYSDAERSRRQSEADSHLVFTMQCCELQDDSGRWFVHEHPSGARSWQHPRVQRVLQRPGVAVVDFDQCTTGLRSPGGLPMRKRTRLMSNVAGILDRFSQLQCGAVCHQPQEHRPILGCEHGIRLSTYCQVYTPQLCRELLGAAFPVQTID